MKFEKYNIHLTDHGFEQYCDRVEETNRDTLLNQIKKFLHDDKYFIKREFIHVDGVWWVIRFESDNVHFVTTYGRTNMDIPEAINWSRKNKDRINLLEPL